MDEIGFFAVDPKPDGSFRLRCRTPDGADVHDRMDQLVSRPVEENLSHCQPTPRHMKDQPVAAPTGSDSHSRRASRRASARLAPLRNSR